MASMRYYMSIETSAGVSHYVVNDVKTWKKALLIAQNAIDKGFYPKERLYTEDTFIRLTTPKGWTRKRLAMDNWKLYYDKSF